MSAECTWEEATIKALRFLMSKMPNKNNIITGFTPKQIYEVVKEENLRSSFGNKTPWGSISRTITEAIRRRVSCGEDPTYVKAPRFVMAVYQFNVLTIQIQMFYKRQRLFIVQQTLQFHSNVANKRMHDECFFCP